MRDVFKAWILPTALAAICTAVVAAPSFGQTFSGIYTFDTDATVSPDPAGVNFSAFTPGPGITSPGVTGGHYAASGWTSAGSPDPNDYVEFSISAEPGQKFTLSSVSYTRWISSETQGSNTFFGPQEYSLRYQVTPVGGSQSAEASLAGGSNSVFPNTSTTTINLSSSTFSNLTNVVFRFYGYNSTNGSNGQNQTFNFENVGAGGSFSAVPEPTTTLLFGGGMAALVAGRLRRRRADDLSLLTLLMKRFHLA